VRPPVAGPVLTAGESVPRTVVHSDDSVTVFKSRLKPFVFSRAFSLPTSR